MEKRKDFSYVPGGMTIPAAGVCRDRVAAFQFVGQRTDQHLHIYRGFFGDLYPDARKIAGKEKRPGIGSVANAETIPIG